MGVRLDEEVASFEELIKELEEFGYSTTKNPKKAGFIFPDGSIVEIGDDDHSLIDEKDRDRFGIHTYRFDSQGSLYLRLYGEVTPEQEKTFNKFRPQKWIFIDVGGYSFEFRAKEIDDLGHLASKVAENPSMFRRMERESIKDRAYRKYVQKILEDYRSFLSLLEARSEKQKRCAQKYAVLDKSGNIKHFKGPAGKGVRFRNCVEYFKCLGKSEEQAKGICAEIARRKCQAGAKYACGRR